MMPAMSAPRALLVSLFVALGFAGRAAASPSYSDLVERHFDMECAPSCLLCHTEPNGGFATANTRLGITLRRQFDAECCDHELLSSILDELTMAATDSDGDGTSDADELRVFRDPNVLDSADMPTALTCQPPAASGGCTAALQPGAPRALWSCLGLLLLAAWCVRRYRRPT